MFLIKTYVGLEPLGCGFLSLVVPPSPGSSMYSCAFAKVHSVIFTARNHNTAKAGSWAFLGQRIGIIVVLLSARTGGWAGICAAGVGFVMPAGLDCQSASLSRPKLHAT
jgi:hypothetical protein